MLMRDLNSNNGRKNEPKSMPFPSRPSPGRKKAMKGENPHVYKAYTKKTFFKYQNLWSFGHYGFSKVLIQNTKLN